MTLKVFDRLFETTNTTGTGTISLAGAQTGYQSFALAGNGTKVYYQINDGTSSGVVNNWEIGIGTVNTGSPNTLTRNTILSSSNSGSAVSFGLGDKNVIGTIPAKGLPLRDENLNFTEGFGLIGGSANALTLTLPVTPLAYSDGMQIAGYIAASNSTAGATIAINGLSAIPMKINGADPGIGNLPAGQLLQGRYKSSTGVFELTTPVPVPPTVPNASTTVSGISELATDAEVKTGTDTTRAVTPANVRNALGFSSFFESAEISYVASATGYSATHSLGSTPKLCAVILRCKTADSGYAVGDEVNMNFGDNNTTFQFSSGANATVCFAGQNGPVRFQNKNGSGLVTPVASSWRVVFRAWA